ncbi:MAG: PmoA family protein [Planctomycetaceae bacterium]|jgi:hypothetical protein
MSRSVCVLLVCVLFGASQVSVRAADVKIIQQDDQLQVKIGDADFATYNYSPRFPKPFFLPVKAADGTVLTRALNDPEDNDHKHHKGIWVAVDEVNGVQHWAEKGPIVTRDVTVLQTEGPTAAFEVTNEWQKPESNDPVVTEKTRISIHSNGLMTYDIRFLAEHGPVEFLDTKEGLLGYRMAPSMKEKNTGRVVGSDGSEGTAACWGRPLSWIDYSGTVDGRTFGVALMDHPDNFRPSRYHVRNYGLFSISPFGERAYTNGKEPAKPVHLKQGEDLRLQYAIYVHQGDVEAGNVKQVWQQFLDVTRESAE